MIAHQKKHFPGNIRGPSIPYEKHNQSQKQSFRNPSLDKKVTFPPVMKTNKFNVSFEGSKKDNPVVFKKFYNSKFNIGFNSRYKTNKFNVNFERNNGALKKAYNSKFNIGFNNRYKNNKFNNKPVNKAMNEPITKLTKKVRKLGKQKKSNLSNKEKKKLKGFKRQSKDKLNSIRLNLKDAWKKEKVCSSRELLFKHIMQQSIIRKGKKSHATKIVDKLISEIKKKYRYKNHNQYLTCTLNRFRTLIFLRSKRVGSMTYKIPVSLFAKKGIRVITRWLVSAGRLNGRKTAEGVVEELMLLSKRRGSVVKKRADLHNLGFSGIPYLRFLRKK